MTDNDHQRLEEALKLIQQHHAGITLKQAGRLLKSLRVSVVVTSLGALLAAGSFVGGLGYKLGKYSAPGSESTPAVARERYAAGRVVRAHVALGFNDSRSWVQALVADLAGVGATVVVAESELMPSPVEPFTLKVQPSVPGPVVAYALMCSGDPRMSRCQILRDKSAGEPLTVRVPAMGAGDRVMLILKLAAYQIQGIAPLEKTLSLEVQ